ncbi:MAG TPA: enoyl-CoA hydratase-related protein [Syntrophales bacterium]|nr:enoyl-CoA hydratase-related protein [Syntrophales bacterium]HOL59213.1 enoyl-CoA hydratase-related protein [Syntrophales bacterium]HPO35263.1 enoyl-CoA hydratase-related protein [Syntrophales bacterium]
MSSEEVLYEKEQFTATITLNRPEKMNTISASMLNDLSQALVEANRDPAVRVVVLTGKGRAFCAGLDLSAQAQGGDQALLDGEKVITHLDLRQAPPVVLFEMDKPVICAMNGSAAGYGLDLALGCDIRIMSQEAKMAAAYVKRGIVPESGGTWFLPRLLGWSKAAEIIFTGRTLPADECLKLGLVSHVVPPEEVMPSALSLAQEIGANAPLAVQAAKRLMRMGWEEPFPIHVHHVFLQLLPLVRTDDFEEGVKSFLEKRPPKFQGR